MCGRDLTQQNNYVCHVAESKPIIAPLTFCFFFCGQFSAADSSGSNVETNGKTEEKSTACDNSVSDHLGGWLNFVQVIV